MKKEKILIIGSLNMDVVVNVHHTPLVGETILCRKMEMVPGGKGANQACAAGCLGADVTILGAVGCDDYAKLQMDSLKKNGVDVSRIIQKQNESTGMAFITVDHSGDNSIVVVSGANSGLSVEDIDENKDLIEECDILMLQMEIPLETVCHAAKLAKTLGKTVILDPAPAPAAFPEELYGMVDVMKPNETELSMLTGMNKDDYRISAGMLRERGVKEVLVTLGEQGVYLDSATVGKVHLPGHKVTVVDTTAAGDAFTAALGLMLARGKSVLEAAEFANLVSSVVVTRKGAQSSIPSREEISELLAQCG